MARLMHTVLLVALFNCFNCFVVFHLKPPVKYQYMSMVVAFASDVLFFIDPRFLAVPEWVKTRYLYLVASTKHRLCGPDRSTSGFLLLPPEIRLRIWDELTPRLTRTREDTRVCVDVYPLMPGIDNAIRSILRFEPRNQTRLRPGMPLALLRTCRPNYEEGSYKMEHYKDFLFQ